MPSSSGDPFTPSSPAPPSAGRAAGWLRPSDYSVSCIMLVPSSSDKSAVAGARRTRGRRAPWSGRWRRRPSARARRPTRRWCVVGRLLPDAKIHRCGDPPHPPATHDRRNSSWSWCRRWCPRRRSAGPAEHGLPLPPTRSRRLIATRASLPQARYLYRVHAFQVRAALGARTRCVRRYRHHVQGACMQSFPGGWCRTHRSAVRARDWVSPRRGGTRAGRGAQARGADLSGGAVRARPGRLRGLRVSPSESSLRGIFVCACGAPDSPPRRLPARAGARTRATRTWAGATPTATTSTLMRAPPAPTRARTRARTPTRAWTRARMRRWGARAARPPPPAGMAWPR
jgi:hypothetical protein